VSDPTADHLRELWNRVSRELLARNVSQRKLADHLGIDPSALSRSLNGQRAWRVTELLDTCEFLEKTPNELLGFEQ